MKPRYKKVETIEEFIGAIRIRVEVFINEQGSKPGWEPDEMDKTSKHYIALVKNEIASTARARESNKKEFKIERMATKKGFRKKGIGKGLVEFIVKDLKKSNPKRIWMQAQVRAREFYENCGFKATSKPYDLYGIMHIDLEYFASESFIKNK